MNPHLGRSRPALLLLGALFWAGSLAAGPGADNQIARANSSAGPRAASVSGSVEFRGAVQEDGVWLVNLWLMATNKSCWLAVGAGVDDLVVKGYDEATGRLSVVQGGQPLNLALQQARVILAGSNTPLKRLGPAERITEAEAPHLPEFMRDLPPEARKLLEEARRRRAIRWPAMPADGALPVLRP